MKISGAQLTIKLLEQQGITHIPGIPGGANLPLYDALSRSKIRHILVRHEQAAGFIAQGMARTDGKPAVCMATSGPGATNLLTAIADAHLDSCPIIAITGQVPTSLIGTDAFQEVDTYGMSLPVTKHNFLVQNAEEIPEIISQAFQISLSDRPGPVLIDMPKDVQLQTIELPIQLKAPDISSAPLPDQKQIRQAVKMIQQAERPIIYAGGGIILSEASGELKSFAEKAQIPVCLSLMALGALPEGHELLSGFAGMHGKRSTNILLRESDLIIALGTRFGDRTTGKISTFGQDSKIIHIDIDAAELGKNLQGECMIRSGVKQALQTLNSLCHAITHDNWINRMRSLQSADKSLESLRYIFRMISDQIRSEPIITTDVGQHQIWTAQYYPVRSPRTFLTSGGLGTMGFGLPAAIGAALKNPERTVLCFTGDGSILMNIQELATLKETGSNVKIILLDNQALGLVRQQQSLFYKKNYFATRFESAPDFCAIASAFGISSLDLGDIRENVHHLNKFLNKPGPALIRIQINEEEMVFPMVPPGGANHETIERSAS